MEKYVIATQKLHIKYGRHYENWALFIRRCPNGNYCEVPLDTMLKHLKECSFEFPGKEIDRSQISVKSGEWTYYPSRDFINASNKQIEAIINDIVWPEAN